MEGAVHNPAARACLHPVSRGSSPGVRALEFGVPFGGKVATFRRHMNRPGPSPSWVFALMVFVAACQPEIGDSCRVHANCSSTGGRICEPNFPGGYCTVFNC